MKADKPRHQLLGANGTAEGANGLSMDGTSQGRSAAGSLPGMPSVHAEGSGERGVERTRTLALSLSRLSAKPQKRQYIVDNGAIPTLVRLAKSSDDAQVQASCASAFVNFAKDEGMRQEIINAGGTSAMSSLSHNPDKTIHSEYLQALINLTATNHNENELVSHGAVSHRRAEKCGCFPSSVDPSLKHYFS